MKILLLLLALVVTGLAEDPNATARFLAGLPLNATDLANFAQTPAWKMHAKQMEEGWSQSEARQMQKIRAGAPASLGGIHSSPLPVFYFFSGPDILYAQALFPNAGTYVLCAKEPVGQVSDPSTVPPEDLPLALAGLRKSLTSLLSWSFFITQDLRVDINQRHFTGILPVLEILLARAGSTITEVALVSCDRTGAIVMGGGKGTPGARIRFTRGTGGPQTLYYFCGDISNGGLGANEGVLRFCEKLGRGQSLLKAASYLPHEAGFSKIRDWILSRSRTIVQDPSGIPFKYLDPSQWQIRLWGREGQPVKLFAKYQQPQLEAALTSAPRPFLPFGFGYQHLPNNAVMIVAERAQSAAPAPAAAPVPVAVPVSPPAPAAPAPAPSESGGLRR
jgi:hypothetical protein